MKAKCEQLFKSGEVPPGIESRVMLTILIAVGWLCFVLLHIFFWADNFGLVQNLVIFIISIIITGGLIAGAWASWAIGMARAASKGSRRR